MPWAAEFGCFPLPEKNDADKNTGFVLTNFFSLLNPNMKCKVVF
jgi:hypothetical protein